MCAYPYISERGLYVKAGLNQHPMQSTLFQNLFLVGGRSNIISIEVPEGSASTHPRVQTGEELFIFREVHKMSLSKTLV